MFRPLYLTSGDGPVVIVLFVSISAGVLLTNTNDGRSNYEKQKSSKEDENLRERYSMQRKQLEVINDVIRHITMTTSEQSRTHSKDEYQRNLLSM